MDTHAEKHIFIHEKNSERTDTCPNFERLNDEFYQVKYWACAGLFIYHFIHRLKSPLWKRLMQKLNKLILSVFRISCGSGASDTIPERMRIRKKQFSRSFSQHWILAEEYPRIVIFCFYLFLLIYYISSLVLSPIIFLQWTYTSATQKWCNGSSRSHL